jgi:hypothetical protein
MCDKTIIKEAHLRGLRDKPYRTFAVSAALYRLVK